MRRIALAPTLFVCAVAFALLGAALPATADATERAEPAMTAGPSSFELFGTRFCFGPTSGCDVTFAPDPEPIAVGYLPETRSLTIFGITLCAEPQATGRACDITWAPPPPAAAWRDMPEIRILAAMEPTFHTW